MQVKTAGINHTWWVFLTNRLCRYKGQILAHAFNKVSKNVKKGKRCIAKNHSNKVQGGINKKCAHKVEMKE